jgi:hypothetical protein
MRDESPEAVARRAADAQRKREERARKKLEAETQATQEELNAAKSFPEYWAAQRANLSEAQRAEYQQREEDVLDIQYFMAPYLNNYDKMVGEQLALPPDERVTLQDLIDVVVKDVKAHGLCESVVLGVPQLWMEHEKDLRKRILSRGGATALLLQYGYRTAIDGYLYERFYQTYLRPRQSRVEIPEVFYVPLKCSRCNTPPTSVSSAMAAAYARTNNYLCANCAGKAAKLRDFTQEQQGTEHQLFDGWGRVKDQ